MKIHILNGNDTLKYAAQELKKYIGMMCGAEAEISSEEGELKLGLLSELSLSEEGVIDPMLDDVIDAEVKGLSGHIAGSNTRSVLMGVYNYLKSAGCAWVRPGKDGEYIENLFTNEVYGDIQECLKDIQDYMRASKVEELEQSIIEYLEEKGEVIMKEDYTSIYDDGEQYEEDLEELKGIISSNLENYLNGIIEEWVDWVRDNGGSRVKTYADIIDYLYEDILDDYMISDNIENNEIKRQIKYAVANYEPTDFENRRDLEIYVISI